MVEPEILFSIYQCCFLAFFCTKWVHKAGSNPTNHASWKLCRSRRWPHLACSMDVIVSKFALLEAEFFCGEPLLNCKGHFCDQLFTKFDDTEYVYQCMIGTPSEAGLPASYIYIFISCNCNIYRLFCFTSRNRPFPPTFAICQLGRVHTCSGREPDSSDPGARVRFASTR